MAKRNMFWGRNTNRKVRSKNKGSDESDEDYVISEEDDDEEEYEAEIDKYGEESYDDEVVEEEEEEEEEEEKEEDVMMVRNVEWPKVKTGPRGNRKVTGCKSRKVNEVDNEDVDLDDDEEEEVAKVTSLDEEKHGGKGIGKRRRVFYELEDDGEEEDEMDVENVTSEKVEDGEDEEMTLEEQENVSHETEKEDDGDYENEGSDEEFTASEDVSLDEEEEDDDEKVVCNKKYHPVIKRTKRKRRSGGRNKSKGRKRRGKRRMEEEDDDDDDDDFVDDCLPPRKKAKTKKKSSKSRRPRTRRRCTGKSDSDIQSSGESDFEYTISEEEREQVREASSLLRNSVKPVVKDVPQLHKSSPVKKKIELEKKMKNVCGICLSEEDMRRFKGTLDCCSHYFCFTCIMEWSKVESRCPLCKQRFQTISKPARGVDLREVVIPIPERDQVYQPTEEELRSYLDPYENTICTECHQGEDDGLMLLCDLCDSSAHTYCVGLGREVPEGNWYCEGCRPVALASSQTTEQQRVSSTTSSSSRPSPIVVSGQDASFLVSPRSSFFNGDYQEGSSPSGLGATTLSRRRTLHRHIQNIINSDRLVNRTGGTSFSDAFVPAQFGHGRVIEPSQPAATQEIGMTLQTIFEERPSNNYGSVHEFGSGESARHLSNATFLGHRPNGVTQPNPLFGNQQRLPSSSYMMPNTMSSAGLQQRVKAHLNNLSSQCNLGQATFEEISTCSIHTILAACGLEHKSSEVHLVPPPVMCPHRDMSMTHGSSSSSSSNNISMRGCCYSCFDSFVEDVVKMILDTRQPHWLRLGLH